MAGFLSELLTKYNLIKNNGVPVTRRTAISFIGATCTDDPSNDQTLISVSGAVLGSAQVDVNCFEQEFATPWISVPRAQTVTIFTAQSPPIAFEETMSISAYFQVKNKLGGPPGRISRGIEVSNISGTGIVTPNGGTSDSSLTFDPSNSMPTALAGTSAVIVPSTPASSLIGQATAPAGVDLWVRAVYSVSRGVMPGTGPTATVTHADVTSGSGVGGTVVNLTVSSTAGVTAVNVDGVTATFSVTDATHLQITTGAFFGIPPSTGAFTVFNPNGPGGDTSGGFTYTSSGLTPLTIFGATLKGWGRSTSIQHSGASCTGWNDVSGNSNNLTVGSGAPTYNTTDANFNGVASVTFATGTPGDVLKKASLALGAANQSIFMWVVCRPNSGSARSIAGFNAGVQIEDGLSGVGEPSALSINGASRAGWASPITNTSVAVTVYCQGANTGTNTTGISVSNGAFVSVSGSGAGMLTSGDYLLGGLSNFTSLSSTYGGEMVDWGIVVFPGNSTGPTPTQLAQLEFFFQFTYGVP